jgi:O-antigen ligase
MEFQQGIKLKWLYIICGLFILLNGIFIANEIFYFTLLPFIGLLIIFYFTSLDKLLWFIVFATPLSVNLRNQEFNLGVSLPSEPFMFGILILFVFKLFKDNTINKSFIKHPITIAIGVNVCWMFITSCTSTLPLISFKFLLSRLWFLVSFYYYGYYLFNHVQNYNKFIWLYVISFTIVIGYTLVNHSQYGFTMETANWVMSPFYNDHTVYGAMLAMFYPLLLGFIFLKTNSFTKKVTASVFTIIFTVALVLSYTRAAWISLIIAAGVLIIVKLRVNWKFLMGAALISLFFLGIFRERLLMKLEKNRQDSSTNLTEHVKSISNISSDASNLERLNRWAAAFRMFKEKPFIGFGPGTYAFRYAPYQFSYEKTIISTNAGDKGNAHSEYIGPLCESGVLGLLTFLAIAIAIIYTAVKLYYQLNDAETKMLVLCTLIGFVTYFIHGALNNFLDTDKASVPFWAFAAFLVAVDAKNKLQQGQIES